MKKIIAALFLATSSFAQDSTPGPWDLFLQQINGDVTAISPVYLHPPGSGAAIFVWQSGTNSKPWLLPYSGGLVLSSGTLTIDGSQVTGVTAAAFSGTIPTSQVSGLAAIATSGSFSALLAKPTTLSGYGITDAYPLSGNPSGFITQAGARTAISLTTTGGSGAATYNNSTGVLNVPQYGAGTVTSVAVASTNLSVSGSPITTSGTIIINSPALAFSTPTWSSGTTATQLSSTRDAVVSYDINATVNISVLAGQSITATLRYADNSGMSTNVVTVSTQTASNSGVLGLSQTNTLKLSGIIPAGKYRQITFSSSGSPTLPSSFAAAQEVLR